MKHKHRLLFLLLFPLLFTSSLYADNTRVWGWCEKGGQYVVGPGAEQSTTKVQASYPGCTVTVFIAGGTTPINIYNQDGTPLSNPFTASSTTGYWFFYVPNGRYDVQLSGAGFTSPFTLGDITVGGSGGGGSGCGVTSTCTIPQGGTSATAATDATHNLQYIAGTSPNPADGAVAVADDAAINLHISVTYFNADTGLTDNSTAFNNTISYLVSRGGGEVFIPCGTYNFTNPVTIDTQKVSMVGESQHCVVLNYVGTGTFLNIVDQPPTGGPHGEYKNFTIALPSGNSSTIGLLSSTSNALYENIQTTNCAASTAYFVSNGVIQAPTSPSYEEKNTWINVNEDHCGIGWDSGSTGNPPTDNFIQYNYFDNISGAASMGQTVFQLDSGPWFMHNYINLACKIDNVTTISSTADAICIKSSGKWKYNTTFLNGEWNNSIGTGTGDPVSVQITSGATFLNTVARVNVFAIPGLGGARVPMDNQAGAAAVSNFQIGADTDADWETGSGTPTTTPVNGSLYTDTVDGSLYVRQAAAWLKLSSGGGGGGTWNPPASGSNCVVKFDTGATTECVPSGTSGYIFQDGAGNISAQPGTGGTAASITYTPTGTNAGALNLQIRSDEATYVTEWKNGAGNLPVCGDTATNNTASLTNAANAHSVLEIPPNCILTVDNWTPPSNTTLRCDNDRATPSGIRHLSSGTANSVVYINNVSNVSVRGCLVDGASINASSPAINVNQSTNIVIDGNYFQNIGNTTLTRAIQEYQSSIDITNNIATNNVKGSFAFLDAGGNTTRRVYVHNNHAYNQADNAIVIENNSGTPTYGNFEISDNDIQSVTDAQAGTGQFGNGILAYNILGGLIAHNSIIGAQFSGIRLGQNTGFIDVADNKIWNTNDFAIYSEEGAFANHIHDNRIQGSYEGIASTNQSSRLLGLPDVIDNNWVYGTIYAGYHCEGCDLHDNYAVNCALPYQIGAGPTTGGSRVYHNHVVINQLTGSGGSPLAGLPLGYPSATGMLIDPNTNSSLQELIDNNDLGSGWSIPVGIVGVNNNTQITAITQATSAVITTSSVNSQALVGRKVCLLYIESMTQANGLCPNITAVSGANITTDMNSTSFTAFAAPTDGSYPSIWVLWNATAGAPVQGLGGTDLVTNMPIPFSVANAGGFKTGSHFTVPDANCVNGALTASGSGTWAYKIASRVGCILDAATGTVSSGNGITNGGTSSGQIQMLDSTSGHTLTVTPQSGLPSNTTVNLPQ